MELNKQLVSLDLSLNDLSDEKTVQNLMKSLSHCPLTSLQLDTCRITDLGVNEIRNYFQRNDII